MKRFISKLLLTVMLLTTVLSVPITTNAASRGTLEFVTRCYKIALGREPDKKGLEDWAGKLTNGEACGVSIAYGFVYSEEFQNANYANSTYTEKMYNMLLGRGSDEDGKSYWVEKLDNGEDRENILYGFANSQEFYNLCNSYGIYAGHYVPQIGMSRNADINAFVNRFYEICLGRRGDIGGQGNWVESLANGSLTGTTLAYGFIFSPEFLNKDTANEEYVKVLYNTFLGREADAAGLESWTEALNKGNKSREEVFNGFAGSIEFDGLCAEYGIVRGEGISGNTYTPTVPTPIMTPSAEPTTTSASTPTSFPTLTPGSNPSSTPTSVPSKEVTNTPTPISTPSAEPTATSAPDSASDYIEVDFNEEVSLNINDKLKLKGVPAEDFNITLETVSQFDEYEQFYVGMTVSDKGIKKNAGYNVFYDGTIYCYIDRFISYDIRLLTCDSDTITIVILGPTHIPVKTQLGTTEDVSYTTSDFEYLETENFILFLDKGITVSNNFAELVDQVVSEVTNQTGWTLEETGKYVDYKSHYTSGSLYDFNPFVGIDEEGKKFHIYILNDEGELDVGSGGGRDHIELVMQDFYTAEDDLAIYVIAHELTHSLTYRHVGELSRTFMEGLAVYYGTVVSDKFPDYQHGTHCFSGSGSGEYDNNITSESAERMFVEELPVDDFSTDIVYDYGHFLVAYIIETYGTDAFAGYWELLKTEHPEAETLTPEQEAEYLKMCFGDTLFSDFGTWYQANKDRDWTAN